MATTPVGAQHAASRAQLIDTHLEWILGEVRKSKEIANGLELVGLTDELRRLVLISAEELKTVDAPELNSLLLDVRNVAPLSESSELSAVMAWLLRHSRIYKVVRSGWTPLLTYFAFASAFNLYNAAAEAWGWTFKMPGGVGGLIALILILLLVGLWLGLVISQV